MSEGAALGTAGEATHPSDGTAEASTAWPPTAVTGLGYTVFSSPDDAGALLRGRSSTGERRDSSTTDRDGRDGQSERRAWSFTRITGTDGDPGRRPRAVYRNSLLGAPRVSATVSLQSRAAAAVDDSLEQLFDRFEAVPVVESEWTVDRVVYDRTLDRFRAGTVGGAGAWVTRDRETDDSEADGGDDVEGDREALLVRHEGEESWSEPAGKQEADESLPETAVRETREETGVDCRITGLLRVERATHVVREVGDDAPAPLPRLVVVFEAAYLGGEASPRDGEIAAAEWWSTHPEPLKYPGVGDLPIE